MDEHQIAKWGDLCGDSDFERNPGSDALRKVRPIRREITRVQYKWWGVCLSKYKSIQMLSLLVREIGNTARTSATPCTFMIHNNMEKAINIKKGRVSFHLSAVGFCKMMEIIVKISEHIKLRL
jgi:hypothetical protein